MPRKEEKLYINKKKTDKPIETGQCLNRKVTKEINRIYASKDVHSAAPQGNENLK